MIPPKPYTKPKKEWTGKVLSRYRVVKEDIKEKTIENVKPRFKEGDYVQVYYGEHENHCFNISEIRYVEEDYASGYGDVPRFEYARQFYNGTRWFAEDNLTRIIRQG